MDILLVRHAKSQHDYSRWKTDDIRPLADIGRERQTKASKGMKELGLIYHTIWVSPFLRAQQTLDIIQDICETDIEPKVVDDLQVWGSPSVVKDLLDEHYKDNPKDKLLLVGHNPNMSDLVELLTSEYIGMSTSDLVHINRDETGYRLEKYYPRSFLFDV